MKTATLIIVVLMIYAVSAYNIHSGSLTLCDTGIEYVVKYENIKGADVMTIVDAQTGVIYVGALDYDGDGVFDMLVFDTNGNGYVDHKLTGGQATLPMVLLLYCQYLRLRLS